MSSGEAISKIHYYGFISYSHRDSVIARTIHHRLEAYRLPKRLVGKNMARGVMPQRLTPVFRDREELSAGESLSNQVQEALAASDCLIILCSPDAKALHGRERRRPHRTARRTRLTASTARSRARE